MENPNTKSKHNVLRDILILSVVLIIGILAYLGYRRPELFKAELTGGSTQPISVDLYIPNDYQAEPGDSGEIAVRAGKALSNLSALEIGFTFDHTKIEFIDVSVSNAHLNGIHVDIPPELQTPGEFFVGFGNISGAHLFDPIDIPDNAVLFRISVDIKQGIPAGDIVINYNENRSLIFDDPEGFHRPSFSPGKITIIVPDADGDGVNDDVDNCPNDPNTNQLDTDGDGTGDVCDTPECGNGYVEGTEECDDGNNIDGDGCNSTCQLEVGGPELPHTVADVINALKLAVGLTIDGDSAIYDVAAPSGVDIEDIKTILHTCLTQNVCQ